MGVFRRKCSGVDGVSGHALVSSLATICCSSDDTFLALSALSQVGSGKAGVCSRKLASLDSSPAFANSALHESRHDFLPLPPLQSRAWLQAQVVSFSPDRQTLIVEVVLGRHPFCR
jgi:hypothetical protein